MSYLRGKGLVCDGCETSIREDDPATVSIKASRVGQPNSIQIELCALCASRERADETTLGKILSHPFCRAPQQPLRS